ncbi:metallophosphoesterase [Millisia brevis]|uniref:metallophosphoesterase n=1 Tax=Millisia brevis TaxID=264148 RepID=UPI00082BD97A|nr:metallophosphoesterase [Millisia brevis]
MFPLILGTIGVLVGFGLYRRFARVPEYPRPVRLGIAAVIAACTGCAVLALMMLGGTIDPTPIRWVAWIGMSWVAAVFYLLLGIVITGVICLGIRLMVPRHNESPRKVVYRRRRAAFMRIATPVVIVATAAIVGYGLVRANDPTTTEVTVAVEGVPEQFDGMRIAVISDIHAGPIRDEAFTRRVVEMTNAARPDLVLLAGDLADGLVRQVGSTLAPLAELSAPLGVYAATGNHEYISGDTDAWIDTWRSLGIVPLLNDSAVVERDGAQIRVVGINDPFEDGMDPDAALADTDPSDFIVQIGHQPAMAEATAGRGVDLQVSGHTHGGQLWPLRYAVLLEQPLIDGVGVVADTVVVTGRGVGSWGPPVRVLADPEIPIVTVVGD